MVWTLSSILEGLELPNELKDLKKANPEPPTSPTPPGGPTPYTSRRT